MAGPPKASENCGLRCTGHTLRRGPKSGQPCTALLLTDEGFVLCHNENHPHHLMDVLGDAVGRGIVTKTQILAAIGQPNLETKEKNVETTEQEFLKIAFGLKGTPRDRDALELAVLLDRTLHALKEKTSSEGFDPASDTLPSFTYQGTSNNTLKGTGKRGVALNYRGPTEGYEVSVSLHGGSTNFALARGYDLYRLYQEMKHFMNADVEEYPLVVNFYRTAISILPYALNFKRMVE